MSWVRSMTFSSEKFVMERTWDGLSSASNTSMSTPCCRAWMTSSESLPLPMRKRASKRGRRCRMVAATLRPAERASSVSSARESSAATPTVPRDADEDGPF